MFRLDREGPASDNPAMDTSPKPKPLAAEHHVDIAKGIIFYLLTCGIYGYYWKYRQFRALNALLGREEFDFLTWLLLTLITFGFYDVYYEYKFGTALQEYMNEHGYDVNPNLGLAGLVLSAMGIWRVGMVIVADAIFQHELNRLIA